MTAEKWVYGGDALSRVDGRVVLTRFMLPGETARVEVEQERPDLIQTRAVEIVSAAPQRVEPPCPYFFRCGGCQYQHAEYGFQVEQKAEILREQLKRVGKIDWTGEIGTIAAEPYGYRNRTQFHVSGRKIGYYLPGSHELLPVEQCPISSPKINEVLRALNEMSGDRQWPQFLRSIEVFTNETDVLLNVESERPLARRFFEWCGERIPGMARGFVDYAAGGDSFRVSHNSFFQVNRFLVERLVEAALEGAEGETALDLYAGVGLFSIAMARRFGKVTAVESGKGAVRDLEFNAGRANVALAGSGEGVEEFLAGAQETPDFVLADPPRAGLGKRVTAELARLKPKRMVIVSCDPATLARDLTVLVGAGYAVESVKVVDMFAQTGKVESVVRLGRG